MTQHHDTSDRNRRRRAWLVSGALLVATFAIGAASQRSADPNPPGILAARHASAGDIRFQGALDRQAVEIGGDGLVRVELVMGADPAALTESVHFPTDLVVVLDRSGSMSGQKIADARSAVAQLVSQLGNDDRFSLVTFASDARKTIPLAHATGPATSAWRSAIAGVAAGGGTHMNPALELAFATLEAARQPQRMPRIVLISDGLAAEPHPVLHAQARRASRGEFALSTVGVGADFDEDLMASLADAGTGNYYYLEHANALAEVFADEFETARETVATGLEVAIRPAAGVEVVSASGYPLEHTADAARFRPGTLFAGQERRVWVTLRVPANREADHDLGSFALGFRRDREIERLVLPALPRVAAVAGDEDFFAGLDVERWARSVVEEEYGELQQAVSRHVQAGRLEAARDAVSEFRTRNAELNHVAASPVVTQQLHAAADLDLSISEAFEGKDAAQKRNTLGKAIHAESYLDRRQGSRK